MKKILKNRRFISLKANVLLLFVYLLLIPGHSVVADTETVEKSAVEKNQTMKNIEKSEDDWKKQLTPEQFAVTRQQCTERPFSGQYTNWKGKGLFKCVCCGAILFDSNHKFDSGTGWPSFFDVAKTKNIETCPDHSLGMDRIEVLCKHCGAHLGHLFPDGPKPTGLRYCINSAALKFEEKTDS